MPVPQTVSQRFFSVARRMARDRAFGLYLENGEWRRKTWESAAIHVRELALGLLEEGLSPGEPVVVMADVSTGTTIAEMAIFALRGIVVPLSTDTPPSVLAAVMAQTGASRVVAEDVPASTRDSAVRERLSRLYVLNADSASAGDFATSVSALQDRGRATQRDEELVTRSEDAEVDDIAVVLALAHDPDAPLARFTHAQVLAAAEGLEQAVPWNDEARVACFGSCADPVLRSLICVAALEHGATLVFLNRDGSHLATADPTMVVAPSRFIVDRFGGVRERLVETGQDRLLAATVRKLRAHYFQRWVYVPDRGPGTAATPPEFRRPALGWRRRRIERRILAPVHAAFGEHTQLVLGWGAHLPEELTMLLEAAGVTVETALSIPVAHGVVAASHALMQSRDPNGAPVLGVDLLGKPFEGLEYTTDTTGRLRFRGASLATTAQTGDDAEASLADDEGWVTTDWMGERDRTDNLLLRSRADRALGEHAGAVVDASRAERTIELDVRIHRVVVAELSPGDIVAIVAPDERRLGSWLKSQGAESVKLKAAAESPRVRELVDGLVDAANIWLPEHARVRRWIIAPEPWSCEDGLLDPDGEVRREEVVARHADLLTT